MSIKDVINAWYEGKSASTKSLHTDGNKIWSYDLLVGYTDELGNAFLISYNAENNHFVSSTTSKHLTQIWNEGYSRDMCPLPITPGDYHGRHRGNT